jgi:RecA-family ATPase
LKKQVANKKRKKLQKTKKAWNGGERNKVFKTMMMLRLNEETKTNNSKAPKMEKSFKATMNETKVFKTTKMSSLKGQQRNNKLE